MKISKIKAVSSPRKCVAEGTNPRLGLLIGKKEEEDQGQTGPLSDLFCTGAAVARVKRSGG
ncbi:MAG: hypothetical protein Q4G68_03955 [Planctomycetia bacterium]|nr:hypothetical protein [Planctomycetia bacterium]